MGARQAGARRRLRDRLRLGDARWPRDRSRWWAWTSRRKPLADARAQARGRGRARARRRPRRCRSRTTRSTWSSASRSSSTSTASRTHSTSSSGCLRPGGVLLISSPNRGRLPPGNPHHVHEYRPEELQVELEGSLQERGAPPPASVARIGAACRTRHSAMATPRRCSPPRSGSASSPGSETYTIAVASDTSIANPPGIVVIGERLRGSLVARAGRPAWPGGASRVRAAAR